ncbi:MAG: 2-C-methyl-D-erythritol 2,4-cyclodiphosphate synthase [Balneolaceae bacterium]
MSFRVGVGYDLHPFKEGRLLILGGVEIPFEKGLMGHSDADVLLHSVSDALLGASALGDIGHHFPDTDPVFENADSLELLRSINNLLQEKQYRVVNVDATIVAEMPKMKPFILQMRENISDVLGCELSQISVKATTHEKLGALGRGEGIAVHSIAMIKQG